MVENEIQYTGVVNNDGVNWYSYTHQNLGSLRLKPLRKPNMKTLDYQIVFLDSNRQETFPTGFKENTQANRDWVAKILGFGTLEGRAKALEFDASANIPEDDYITPGSTLVEKQVEDNRF